MKTDLSPREMKVLELASEGYTDDMIAQELSIETGTVNSYWVRIRGKRGHFSRTELVARFVRGSAAAGHAQAMSDASDISDRAAIDSATTHKRELDAAHVEIERLKKLLKKKSLST